MVFVFLPPLDSILVLETKGGMTHDFYPNSDFLHANPWATHWFKRKQLILKML